VLDALDTADVVSEAEHAYVSPAPLGGWTLFDVRRDDRGTMRFDAGRITPEGQSERFVASRGTRGPATLRVRTDGEACAVDVSVGGGEPVPLGEPDSQDRTRWASRAAEIARGIEPGEAIVLSARRGTLRDFHVWMVPQRRASAE
jgi:hypothetical protein